MNIVKCDRCGNVIQKPQNGTTNAILCHGKFEIYKQFMSDAVKVDLCEECEKDFEEFLNAKKSENAEEESAEEVTVAVPAEERKYEKNKRIKLTKNALAYNWKSFGEYRYIEKKKVYWGSSENYDFPYEIAFERIPKKRKRKITVYLMFDKKAEYAGVQTNYKYSATEAELQAWADEALSWLYEKGYLEDAE